MTPKASVLVIGAPVPVIEQGLAQRFDVVREARAGIRGLAVAGGHVRIDAALMDTLPDLQVVASLGVGYDHVDAKEAARRGVVVTHTPDVLTGEVADLAMCLLLSTIRQIPQADRWAIVLYIRALQRSQNATLEDVPPDQRGSIR